MTLLPERVRIEYRGTAPWVSALCQMLDEEGLDVEIEGRLIESRGLDSQVIDVVLWIADKTGGMVIGAVAGRPIVARIDKAVRRFKDRVPKAEVKVFKRQPSSTDGSE